MTKDKLKDDIIRTICCLNMHRARGLCWAVGDLLRGPAHGLEAVAPAGDHDGGFCDSGGVVRRFLRVDPAGLPVRAGHRSVPHAGALGDLRL